MSTTPQDPNNLRLERSVSLFDQTHQFQFSWVWQLALRPRPALRFWDAERRRCAVERDLPLDQRIPGHSQLAERPERSYLRRTAPESDGTLERNPDRQADLANYFANPEVVQTPGPVPDRYRSSGAFEPPYSPERT